ncbi:DUF692 domain-containing protein [Alicyclobacillus fastidiosus]|uniref:DUF692 domain-containing protein n=1 Tax=Alicyclobacillus fastidiosus TaxID=392011 RepID=UPI0023E985D7|nr:DUF692 family multinuclear iron-containing protein [Alicyclobacillus fastidiosus]GMA66058.1 UPF0276 protein [Alicyclobacillus fastidiosus]
MKHQTIEHGNRRAAIGIGLRSFMQEMYAEIKTRVDFFEFNIGKKLAGSMVDWFSNVSNEKPVVLHSIDLSTARDEEFDMEYVNFLKTIYQQTNPCWISEHLSFKDMRKNGLKGFIPVPRTRKSLEVIERKLLQLHKEFPGTQLLLENVTSSFVWKQHEMSEAEFLNRVCEQGSCGLLLDITNVYINSVYHNYDPYEFLRAIDRRFIKEIHIAGYTDNDGTPYDTHVGDIPENVLRMLDWVLDNTDCEAILIERDDRSTDLDSYIEDIERVQKVVEANYVFK